MADVDYEKTYTTGESSPTRMSTHASDVDLDYCAHQVLRAGRYLEEGKIAAAEASLRQGLERVPEHTECMAYLAVCLAAGKRKYVTAEKLLKNIIKNNPYDSTAWYALGRINLLGGRREQAFRNFEKARKMSRDDVHMEIAIEKMDPRRGPVLVFLDRDNFLNILLGQLRSKFSG